MGGATSAVVFGLVPHVADQATRADIERLCSLLSVQADEDVVPFIASSPAALASALEVGSVQLAWLSPTLLLMSDGLTGTIPLLSSVRQGVAFFHSVLFVASDSPIKSVDDLRGRHAAWVARTSASGYIAARISLVRQGCDPHRLFAKESFLDAHGAVARAVLEGRADVGATFAVFEQGDPKRHMINAGYLNVVPHRGGRVIDATGPIPSDMIVAHAALSLASRARLADALTKVVVDRVGSVLVKRLIGAEGFEPFSQASFLELDALLTHAKMPGVIE